MLAVTSAAVVFASSLPFALGASPEDVGAVRTFLTNSEVNDVLFPTVRVWEQLPIKHHLVLANLLSLHLPDTTRRDIEPVRFNTVVRPDVTNVGGRAAWGVEIVIKPAHLMPFLHDDLSRDERAARVREIRRYVTEFAQVVAFLTAPDYPAVAAGLDRWKKGPVWERVRAAEMLAGRLLDTQFVGLRNNTRLDVFRRPPPELADGQKAQHVSEDVYNIGDRAAWAIRMILGEDLNVPLIIRNNPQRDPRDAAIEIGRMVRAYRAGVEQAVGPPK